MGMSRNYGEYYQCCVRFTIKKGRVEVKLPAPAYRQEGEASSRLAHEFDNSLYRMLVFVELLRLHQSGAVAQLGERLNGIQEADGSIPFSSTIEIFF